MVPQYTDRAYSRPDVFTCGVRDGHADNPPIAGRLEVSR